jgi:outer membrane receptor for ferrienterochelin and colicins
MRSVFRHGRKCSYFLGMVAGLWWSVPAARANSIGDLESLLSENIVTSASKNVEGASESPALSTSLSADDLRRYGIKTIAEAIDFLSIGVKTSDNLNGGEIGSRGVLLTGDQGSHFLLLVDGHAMNDPLRGGAQFGVGAGIPIEQIDHIEVIVGAGSVLYGSNAMLGVINVITKRAKDNAGLHLIVESSLATSIRAGAAYARPFTLLGRDAELTVYADYYRQAGPYMTFGPVNTGVDAFTGNPGRNTRDAVGTGIWGGSKSSNSPFAQVPSAGARLILGNFELSFREIHYKHSAPTGIGNYDDRGTHESEVRRSFDLKYHRSVSTLLDIFTRVYGDHFSSHDNLIASRESLCPYGPNGQSPTCNYRDKGTAAWTGLDVQTSWDWLRDARLLTMAGTDIRWRFLRSTHDVVDVDTGVSVLQTPRMIPGIDTSDITIGAFLQQTWTPVSALHFNAGLRVDRDSRFDTVLVKRLSGNWAAWKNGLLKLSYAEAFRAPSWIESNDSAAGRIAGNSGIRLNGMDAGNTPPGVDFGKPLKPETVMSVEASIQHKLGTHRFLVGVFYSRWDNLVELRQLSATATNEAERNQLTAPPPIGALMTQYQNAAAIDNYGFNASIDGDFGHATLQYGITATLAKTKTARADPIGLGMAQGERNGNISPTFFGNARVAYVPGGMVPTLAIAAQFMGERRPDQYLVMADGSTLEPYAPAQVETRLTVSGAIPKVRRLTYRLMANYTFSDRGPYTVGPLMVVSSSQTQTFSQTAPQLIPVDRFRITIGLQADF